MLFKVLSFYLYKEIAFKEVNKKSNNEFTKKTLVLKHSMEE